MPTRGGASGTNSSLRRESVLYKTSFDSIIAEISAKIGNILYNSAIFGGRIEICIRPSVPCAPAKPVAGTKLLVRHRAAKKRTESGEKNFAIGLPVCGIYANFVTENPAK
jgi:hypothetical protein